jgi:hypothetical protein
LRGIDCASLLSGPIGDNKGAVSRRTVLCGLTIALGTSPLKAALANKRHRTPGYLNAHCGAFDPVRRKVYIFGGADESRVLDNFWQYDGKNWQLCEGCGPVARTFAAAAFDCDRD